MPRSSAPRSRSRPRASQTETSQKNEDAPESPIAGCQSGCSWCRNEKERKRSFIPTDSSDSDRILVMFNVNLFSVVKFDYGSETVTLDIGLTFEWHDPHLAAYIQATDPNVLYGTHPQILRMQNVHTELWPENKIPGIYFFDPAWKIKGASQTEILKNITTCKDGISGHVHTYVQCLVTYPWKMDLTEFPFDIQEIKCEIMSEHIKESMQFVPDTVRVPRIFHVSHPEWRVVHDPDPAKKYTMKLSFDDISDLRAGSNRDYATCSFSFVVQRVSGWYINNLYFVSFLTVLASIISTFNSTMMEIGSDDNIMEKQDFPNRLQILFTTWLLLISLKFVASSSERLHYLTGLDEYFSTSNKFMFSLVVYVNIIQAYFRTVSYRKSTIYTNFDDDVFGQYSSFLQDNGYLQRREDIVMWTFLGAWVFLHLGIFFRYFKIHNL